MATPTYKHNRKCDTCGVKITDQNTTGLCRKCYTKKGVFVGKKQK